MIVPMIVPCTGFGLHPSIDPFHSGVLLPRCQSTKPTAKSKVIMKLENGVLFVYLRFHNGDDPGSIAMERKIF